MFKKIVVILLVEVFAFGGFVSYRPAIYRVERSAVVRAPAAEVYSRVADLTKWEGWSPWAKLDPAMKVDFSGTPGTVLDNHLTIACGDGSVRLTEVQRAGKRPMLAEDFLRGVKLGTGATVG